jgi:Flp pilus assembly pilin Flp
VYRLLQDEAGAEQMEYVLLMAMVIVPLAVAIRLFWATLLFYFTVESLVVDLPFF